MPYTYISLSSMAFKNIIFISIFSAQPSSTFFSILDNQNSYRSDKKDFQKTSPALCVLQKRIPLTLCTAHFWFEALG